MNSGVSIINNKSVCKRCVLSIEDDPYLKFDRDGVCNYCVNYGIQISALGSLEVRKKFLSNKIKEIKEVGKKRQYDCILGLSGGVDSSYLAQWAKEAGLRPLVIHFDNGWNSELAVGNIQKICSSLNFDLNTFVINWDEFKSLQLAYLRAGVVDVEVLTDHAIIATISRYAKKYRIRYTLSGFNLATEAIMPKGWVFDKTDWENIKDIYQHYGVGKRIRSFPHTSFYQKLINHWFYKLESVQVLNYLPYNKFEAKRIIADKLGWRDYGGKHYESVFTKFYQAYILPIKFGIDKRRAHLSNLICSGQMSKEEALIELENPLYEQSVLSDEKRYVLKKLGLTEEEFELIMKQPPRKHEDFKTEKLLWDRYFRLIKLLKFKKN